MSNLFETYCRVDQAASCVSYMAIDHVDKTSA